MSVFSSFLNLFTLPSSSSNGNQNNADSEDMNDSTRNIPTSMHDQFVQGEPFLQLLLYYSDIRKILSEGEFHICCPASSCLEGTRLSKDQIMSHIFIRGRMPGEFKSINGYTVMLLGNYFILENNGSGPVNVGPESERRIRILHTTSRVFPYPSSSAASLSSGGSGSYNSMTIYHTNQQLFGGIKSPEEYDEIGSHLVLKYIATLKSFPNIEMVIKEMDDFCNDLVLLGNMTALEGYDKIRPSLAGSLQEKWQNFTQSMVNRMVSLKTNQQVMVNLTPYHIGQIVETYLFRAIAGCVYAYIAKGLHTENLRFHQRLLSIRRVRQADLEIRQEVQTNQQEAVYKLASLGRAVTPVDKLLVMKRVVRMIYDSVNENVRVLFRNSSALTPKDREQMIDEIADIEFATDELVLVLIWVIIQCSELYDSIYVDLQYVKDFHFASSSKSPIAYTMCHFEVAIAYLTNEENITNIQKKINPAVVAVAPAPVNSLPSNSPKESSIRTPKRAGETDGEINTPQGGEKAIDEGALAEYVRTPVSSKKFIDPIL